MIAVCGLDCGSCDIRLVPDDPAAARRVAAWFQQMGWLAEDEGFTEVIERRMYCRGCHSDRSLHWSADCRILHCCVDGRGLAHCHECADFPCKKLVAWAQQNASYTKALARLQAMHTQLRGSAKQ